MNKEVASLFRKDYAFLELVIGIAAFLIPIIVVLTLEGGLPYERKSLLVFSVFGLILGFASGYAILEGYYKLTEKLKFMEYEDYKKSQKSKS